MIHFDAMSALGGMSALGIAAHAVNSYPPPETAKGKWLLGIIQYVVGQRLQAQQTVSSTPVAAPTPEPAPIANAAAAGAGNAGYPPFFKSGGRDNK